ncbi:MAG TPA: sugar ABC transporter ATP-binding protein [Vicinamibacterales bacterium]|nr:sugar ABC transporter ATP-binding protein [Vicinamibacterales bacterium]
MTVPALRERTESAGFVMRGIRKAFGATLALDGVDFSVAPGEICGLVGQNGAGKSTLMAILSGALQPDGGTMTIEGRAYAPKSPIEARRAGVAMIYQELSLAPHLSVMENMLLGVEPTRYGLIDRTRMRAMAREALAQLGHEDIPPDATVSSLSVAAQQLVEIARAIAVGCRVLVLDEPTSSLGLDDVRRLFALLERLKAQGHAIVYISHFIEEVKTITDRFVVLRDGRNAGAGSTAGTPNQAIVSLMVGAAPDDLFPRTPRQAGDAILEVTALEPGSATFTLHRGEILGIAGLMGAGRTRLLRRIFGLEPVRSGRIRVGAYSGSAAPPHPWSAGMGLLSEDRKNEGIALSLSVADNLTMTRLDPFGPGVVVLPSRQREASARWISRIDIKCAGPGQAAAELSGGNQQKIAIARLLHHDVDVFILDEPTRGIDVGSKAQIYKLIDGLVAASGDSRPRAVLMVSSYLPELLGLCDRIAVMRRGRLEPPRPAAGLTEHDLMMQATGAAG